MSRSSGFSRIGRPLLAALMLLALTLACSAAPVAQAQHRAPARPPAAPAPASEPAETVDLPVQAPLDKQVEMFRKILPQAKRVGLIYDPDDPVSVAAIKQMLDLLSKAGMSPVEVMVPHEWDVGPAARNLIGRVDLIYTIFDDKVAPQYPVVVQTCDQAHIPLFTADPGQVRLGAMAALGLPGKAQEAVRATARTAAGRQIRPERPMSGQWLYLNLDAAARQGVTVPDDILKSAVLVSQPGAADAAQTKSDPPKADGVKR